jgi:hypothetical protein
MRIYVAGPMTGIPKKNFPEFAKATKALRKLGYFVINPAELDVHEPKSTWEDCLRRDIKQLISCDAVALLPGHENSRGARLETHIAKALSMAVYPVYHFLEENNHENISSDR